VTADQVDAADQLGLFDEPGRTADAPPETLTPGERLRRAQATKIRNGLHPLSGDGRGRAIIRLHPDASRDPDDRAGPGPRCGDCRFREQVHGGARSYPKCTIGTTVTPSPAGDPPGSAAGVITKYGPRVTHGETTDVRAWWPACTDHEPTEETRA
jgi:hypothetical protein